MLTRWPCALVLAWLAPLPPPGSAGEEGRPAEAPASAEFWRRPENDGLNCLFLQARTLGYPERFETYYKTVGRPRGLDQLNGLAAAAGKLGVGLVPAKLTLAELETVNAPTLVHLEQQESGTGYYALVLGFDEENVVLIHGGKATAEPVSRDIFRREWSGFALVPRRETGRGPLVRRGLAALMVAWAAAAVGNRASRTLSRRG